MNVDYTGRQTTITKKLKTQTEAGLDRIAALRLRTPREEGKIVIPSAARDLCAWP